MTRHLSTSRFTVQEALDISHHSSGSSLNGKWTVGDVAEGLYSKVNNENHEKSSQNISHTCSSLLNSVHFFYNESIKTKTTRFNRN